MPIRFPDLQILFPRVTEVPRVQPGPSQQAHLHLHAQGAQIEQERERRRTALEHPSETEKGWIRRERRSGGQGRDEPPKKGSDGARKGRHIDIEV